MNTLSSEKDKRRFTDLVIERSMELYGYTPEEKSDENIQWMLKNGYIKEKSQRRGVKRRRSKTEIL